MAERSDQLSYEPPAGRAAQALLAKGGARAGQGPLACAPGPAGLGPCGLEPQTFRLLAERSDQLSYEPLAGRAAQALMAKGGPRAGQGPLPAPLAPPAWAHAGLNRRPFGYWPNALTN